MITHYLFLHNVYYYSGEVVDYPLLVLLDATVFEIIFTGLENLICTAFAFDEVSEKKAQMMQRDDFADFANVHFDEATCRTYIILKIEYDLSLNKT